MQVLLAATTILFASTCVYYGYGIAFISRVNDGISSASTFVQNEQDVQYLFNSARGESKKFYVAAAALTVNVSFMAVLRVHDYNITFTFFSQIVISDSIVWWRAFALWPRNILVRSIGVVMITATLGKSCCTMDHNS